MSETATVTSASGAVTSLDFTDQPITSHTADCGIGAFAKAHGLRLEFKERSRPAGSADAWGVSLVNVELNVDGASPVRGNGATKKEALASLLAQISGKPLVAYRDRPNQLKVLAPHLLDDLGDLAASQSESATPPTPPAPAVVETPPTVITETPEEPESAASTTEGHSEQP